MQYSMKEWNQHNDVIEEIANKMTVTEWYLRPTADRSGIRLNRVGTKFNA